MDRQKQNEREANRIHCRETRRRKKETEIFLKEELENLSLFKDIVESGPDLFSCHRVEPGAPFSFVCEKYYHCLSLSPDDVVGRPLASIVDPRDGPVLAAALNAVFSNNLDVAAGRADARSGTLVNLRVSYGGVSCNASMTLVLGSQGLIVVTRLYGHS
ncbi:unnamed protein product [Pylaiella littoralis]